MQYPVSKCFQLIVDVFLELASDIVNKGLKISEIFLEEGFELRLCDWSSILVAAFMLCLFEIDDAKKK